MGGVEGEQLGRKSHHVDPRPGARLRRLQVAATISAPNPKNCRVAVFFFLLLF